jgi:hypothetical protein
MSTSSISTSGIFRTLSDFAVSASVDSQFADDLSCCTSDSAKLKILKFLQAHEGMYQYIVSHGYEIAKENSTITH